MEGPSPATKARIALLGPLIEVTTTARVCGTSGRLIGFLLNDLRIEHQIDPPLEACALSVGAERCTSRLNIGRAEIADAIASEDLFDLNEILVV